MKLNKLASNTDVRKCPIGTNVNYNSQNSHIMDFCGIADGMERKESALLTGIDHFNLF